MGIVRTCLVIFGIVFLVHQNISLADPYKILGVSEDASLEEVEKAYQDHPLRKEAVGVCPVCLEEDLTFENAVRSHCECKSGYHSACLSNALTFTKDRCPTCRALTYSERFSRRLESAYLAIKAKLLNSSPNSQIHSGSSSSCRDFCDSGELAPSSSGNSFRLLLQNERLNISNSPISSGLESLSRADEAALFEGRSIVKFEVVNGAPWPKFIYYKFLATSAERAAEIYFDFQSHYRFSPGVVSSCVRPNRPLDKPQVTYSLRMMPGFSQQEYTVEYAISFFRPQAAAYFSWEAQPNAFLYSGNGSVLFLPMNAGTLMKLETFMHPKTWGANLAFVVSRAKDLLVSNAEALSSRILNQD